MGEQNPTENRTQPRQAAPAQDEPTGDWTPSSDGVQLAVPQRIGPFEVRAVLGTGTYGRVFLGFHPVMHRQVAIKQPFGEGLKPEYRDDFLKEARAAAAIDHHPNICPIYHVDTEGGLPYIVMRFVAGGTLKSYLERRPEFLPVRSALTIAAKIAAGLVAAHAKGVIHRDLKPANVLVDAEKGEVLITDFGLARIASQTMATASLHRGAHGTPYYMPPEQWGSKAFGPITPASDLYSLGVILFEMLTGEVPFTGSPFELMTRHCAERPRPPSALRHGLDPRIDAIVLKTLEKHPSARYRSAKEFSDAVAAYLRGTGTGPTPSGEMLPLGEELPPAPPPPGPQALPWAQPLPDRPQPQRPGASPPGATTASPPDSTIDEKEVVRCPKCSARLEVAKNRLRPIDCPMCNLKFAVEAGRQAAARAEREKPPPLPPPLPPVRREERKPRRDERADDRREGVPPWRWKPAARGLKLVCIGLLISGLFAFGLCAAAVASLGGEPSRAGEGRGTSTAGTYSGAKAASADDSTSFHIAYAVLGVGLAAGIVVVSVGRVQAARLPEGVRGGAAATLSAVCGWVAAACVSVFFVFVSWLLDGGRDGPRDTSAGWVLATAAAAATLLLLASEFAFNRYFSAVARRVRRAFPQTLVGLCSLLLWALLACILFGAASIGITAALDEGKKQAHTFLIILSGGAMCLTALLLPLWAMVALWLNVHAAIGLGRYAHSEG